MRRRAAGAILCFSFGVILTYVLAGAQVPGGLVMAKLVVYTATWALCAVVGAIGGAAAVRHVLRRLGGRRFVSARPGSREGGGCRRAGVAMVGAVPLAHSSRSRCSSRRRRRRQYSSRPSVPRPPLRRRRRAAFPGYCAAANATQIIADGAGSQDAAARAAASSRRPT